MRVARPERRLAFQGLRQHEQYCPPPVVTSYMAEGSNTPQDEMIRRVMERLERVEAENMQLRGAGAGIRCPLDGEGAGPSVPVHTPSVVTPVPHFQANAPPQPTTLSPREREQMGGMHHNLPSRDEFEEYLNDWIRRQPFQLPPLPQHRPYPIEIEAEEFPRGFTMPNLDRFNGKGNPHEHLMKFTLTLGNIAYNLFGSSLTGDAFQWYLTLPTGSVRTWEEMQ